MGNRAVITTPQRKVGLYVHSPEEKTKLRNPQGAC